MPECLGTLLKLILDLVNEQIQVVNKSLITHSGILRPCFFKNHLTVHAYAQETVSCFSSCCAWSRGTGKWWALSDGQQS